MSIADGIRKKTIELIHYSNAPHVGSALSCVEILSAIYSLADLDAIRNQSVKRDRIILSKGHAIASQLATLSEFGILEWNEIKTSFCDDASEWFENTSFYTPYIETATGSLGQGLSFSVGAALGMRMRGYNRKVYAILGDGECNEGQCWEAAMQAARFKLDNLIVLVDANGLAGIESTCSDCNWLEKFQAFGFESIETDGHDENSIRDAISELKRADMPKAVICHTKKGYGVSFMENDNVWHYRPISDDTFEEIKKELNWK